MRIPFVDLSADNASLKPELVAALERVIGHGQFILGPEVARLEAELAAFLQVPHVVGVSNGTDALVMALKLAGVGAGHEVITPSHGFVATGTAILLAGATPVFVDVEEHSMLVTAKQIEPAITARTRAVMPVHLTGCPVDLAPIAELCRRRGLVLIEDCAQAIGARAMSRSVGAVELGCFSLHPLKILAALGDGGFITVQSEEKAQRLRQMRNIGLRDRDHCDFVDGNNRLDAVQAAFLLAKLPHLARWISARRQHAAAYRRAFEGLVTLPPDDPAEGHQVYSAFVIRHPERDRLAAHLKSKGIDTRIHYPIPLHRQRAFSAVERRFELPVTEKLCEQILSLPIGASLTEAQRDEVIFEVRAFCGAK